MKFEINHQTDSEEEYGAVMEVIRDYADRCSCGCPKEDHAGHWENPRRKLGMCRFHTECKEFKKFSESTVPTGESK